MAAHENRGSSEGVGTILALATLLVFSGLAVPALDHVTDTAAYGTHSRLDSAAQRLSAELAVVDRLVRRSHSPGVIGREVGLPRRIGGERYVVTITWRSASEGTIHLETASGSTAATARFVSDTQVADATLTGGPVFIVREAGATAIVVRTAPP